MRRRLSFTRLSLFEQPLIFIASSFILGMLFAARFQFSTRAWLVASAVLWAAISVRLFIKRDGRVWIITCLLLALSFSCGGALWEIDKAGAGADRLRSLFE